MNLPELQDDFLNCEMKSHISENKTAKLYCKKCKICICHECFLDDENHDVIGHNSYKMKIEDLLIYSHSEYKDLLVRVESQMKNIELQIKLEQNLAPSRKKIIDQKHNFKKILNIIIQEKLENILINYDTYTKNLEEHIDSQILNSIYEDDYYRACQQIKMFTKYTTNWEKYSKKEKYDHYLNKKQYELNIMRELDLIKSGSTREINFNILKEIIDKIITEFQSKVNYEKFLEKLEDLVNEFNSEIKKESAALEKEFLNLKSFNNEKLLSINNKEKLLSPNKKEHNQKLIQIEEPENRNNISFIDDSFLNKKSQKNNVSPNDDTILNKKSQKNQMIIGIISGNKNKQIEAKLTIYSYTTSDTIFTLSFESSWFKKVEKISNSDIYKINKFPPENSRYVNLGNSILITGGQDSGKNLVTCSLITVESLSFGNNIISITNYPNMLEGRERHNMIYLRNKDLIVVCGGFNSISSEMSKLYNEWEHLNPLAIARANATMLYANNRYLYCFSGFTMMKNEKKNVGNYLNSCEFIDMENTNHGWVLIENLSNLFKINLKVCAMGVIQLSESNFILVGGYDGTKNANTVHDLQLDSNGNIYNIINLGPQKGLGNGVIFPYSLFIKYDDKYINLDWYSKKCIYDNISKNFEIC